MIKGQVLRKWWSDYVRGAFKTPSAIRRAALQEFQLPPSRFLEIPPDVQSWQAPERLKALAHFSHNSFLSQCEKADWQHADKRLQRWAALFCEYARARGIPLYVHSCFRTKSEQDALASRGVSKVHFPNSAHNIGEAVDIVHGLFHWDLTAQEWSLLHVLGLRALARVNATLPKAKKLHLNWGGDDGSPSDRFRWDPAHWEIKDYRSRIRPLSAGVPVRLTPRAVLSNRYNPPPLDFDALWRS